MLNKRQTTALWVGIILVALMCLFPPWLYTLQAPNMGQVTNPAGYAFVFAPPERVVDASAFGIRVDTDRLLIQLLAVSIVTAGCVIF